MRIELLMRSLDQEFSDRSIDKKYNHGKKYDRWPFDYWSHDRHCDRWSYQQSHQVTDHQRESLSSYVKLRKESFGGVLYDMLTKAVFKLDNEAFQAISLLVSGVAFHDLSKHMNATDKEFNTLKASLLDFRLCKI